MNLEIREIIDREIWESFLWNCEEKTFLDSWNWGEFQKKEGNKIWRLGILKGEKLIGLALVIKIKAKRGTFLFVPHGPVVVLANAGGRPEMLKIFIDKLKEIARQEKASFIRIAPIWQKSKENYKIFKDLGVREAPIHMHPELTWELDIKTGENDLLKNMRKTTRYLIRQAEKNNDIEIVKSSDINDLDKFYNLYRKTVKRHHFTPFSLDYLKNQFSCFRPDNQILIFLGKYRGELISSAIVVFWQNIAFYHHGASLSGYNSNKIPVSYLLQWEAIKEAKKRGCQRYNFWGIAPENAGKNHPWKGLTLFKTGFGGYKREYVKTQDLVLSMKYYLTYIIETIRKTKRGL